MSRPADPIFADPRLARIYDDIDGDRDDLDLYVDIVGELDARRVLDIGCGTGTLACRLTGRGIDVVGVDPALASLDIARGKPGADAVTWIHGDATALPPDPPLADLAVMTGNVAQVFVTDHEWSAALDGIGRALRADGRLVFETRNPARRAWENWDTDGVPTRHTTAVGDVDTWTSVLDVAVPLVSFRHHHRFVASQEIVTSDSTLRFRSLDEIEADLAAHGFDVDEVRDAPDRPGLEFVVIAHRSPSRAAPA
ncbi:MAG: class I SAM-dependent methyltransferase [Ilumatobacter sp.]|uniref:class I SAM-dependent methyltransferase n=1 Tax=Ilumatobacter sp. TaxID=1967498 RepID=UPI003299CEE6